MNRILTIQIEITDKEKAAWIWENHSGKDTGNGVYVQVIQEGEIPKENLDNYIPLPMTEMQIEAYLAVMLVQ